MRAVRCVEGCATVVDTAAPTGDGVRVRIASSGVCGSDLHMLELGFFDPFTIGHEFAGYTDDGRAVAVEPIRGCGVCGLCRAGDYNRCPETLNNICGITRDGGMADEAMVSPDMLVPLPAGVGPRGGFRHRRQPRRRSHQGSPRALTPRRRETSASPRRLCFGVSFEDDLLPSLGKTIEQLPVSLY